MLGQPEQRLDAKLDSRAPVGGIVDRVAASRRTDEARRREALDRKNLAIREELLRSGTAWITSTVLRGKRVLRTTMMNLGTDEEILDELLASIRRIAEED